MWLRLDDSYDDDPAILGVCRTQGDLTRVIGYLVRLQLFCARKQTDGYIPEIKFKDIVRSPKWRDLLTNPPAGGIALVHRRGDLCPCMINTGWPAGSGDYYVHHYLQANPSREETDVARAKQAELRDRELQAIVRKRDQGRCRYCEARVVWADRRSSMGGVFDHVDPNVAAGASNLVVACRGCNSRKGNRTPDAAGMTLLPVPTPAPSTVDSRGSEGWPAARPVDGAGLPHRAPSQEQESDLLPTNWSALDQTTHAPVRDGTGRDGLPPVPDADGRSGAVPAVGPPSTPRTSRHPNPYRRTGITGPNPLDHAGLPTPDDLHALDHHDAFMPEGGP